MKLIISLVIALSSASLTALAMSAPAPNLTQKNIFAPTSPSLGDWYGSEVAIDGALIMISAPFRADVFASQTNKLESYENRSGTWVKVPIDVNARINSDYGFGESLSMTNAANIQKRVAVGSRGQFVRVFDKWTDRWSLMKEIIAPNSLAGYDFGRRVAIAGETLAVAAHLDRNAINQRTGAVYIYKNSVQTSWGLDQVIYNPGTEYGDVNFGGSLAISDRFLVVGASYASDTKGLTYIYEKDGTGKFVLRSTLSADTSAPAYSNFGRRISLAGQRLLISSLEGSGTIYVYSLQSGVFRQIQKIANPEPSMPQFGYSLSASGDVLVAGFNVGLGGASNGKVYQLNISASTGLYEVIRILKPAIQLDSTTGDGFGYSLSANPNQVLIGSPLDNGGKAYLFSN